MFFIPGFLISILTFPGVIVHEFAHLISCKLTETKVLSVCYFRVGNPSGYVIHEIPISVWRHILIGIGPFFVNSLVGFLIGCAAIAFHLDPHNQDLLSIAVFWLAVSIAMHSFPSRGDAKSIWKAVWSPTAPVTARIIGSPLVSIIWIGAIGSIFWLNLGYAIVIVLVLPKLIYGIPLSAM